MKLLIAMMLITSVVTYASTTIPSSQSSQSQIQDIKNRWQSMTPDQKQTALAQVRSLIERRKESCKEFFNSLSPEQRAAFMELREERIEVRKNEIKAKLSNLTPEQKAELKTKYEQHKATSDTSIINTSTK